MQHGVRSGQPSPIRPAGAVGGGGGTQPVIVKDGFLQTLPPRALIFFQRAYFANYPRPLQKAGLPSYPFPVQIASILAPDRQAIIFRSSVFKVYQNTGIAPGDQIEVPRSRVATYFGFQTQLGQSGIVDFNTNLNATGQVLAFNPAKAQLLQNAVAPTPGQGSYYPFPGNAQAGLTNFAYYVRPGQQMQFNAIILRPPPYEATQFSVEISGYNVAEAVLEKVLGRLSSGSE
jgi:hypothetical protein